MLLFAIHAFVARVNFAISIVINENIDYYSINWEYLLVNRQSEYSQMMNNTLCSIYSAEVNCAASAPVVVFDPRPSTSRATARNS
jgi:hypothetical protein